MLSQNLHSFQEVGQTLDESLFLPVTVSQLNESSPQEELAQKFTKKLLSIIAQAQEEGFHCALTIAAVLEDFKTLPSNTGSNCQILNNHPSSENNDVKSTVSAEVSIDYFQGVVTFPTLTDMQTAFKHIAVTFRQGEVFFSPGVPMFAGVLWENTGQTFDGMKVAYNILDSGFVRCWVSIPGTCFHRIELRTALEVLVYMRDVCGWKCSRIDAKIRDLLRRKTPTELAILARNGEVARVKKYYSCGSGDIGEVTVDTVYLGSRQSERFLRVYDALPVHKVDAIDWEMQCRDELAQQTFNSLCDCYNAPIDCRDNLVSAYISGVVLGVVEFVHKIPGVRLSRCPRHQWWLDFIKDVGERIRHSIPSKTYTVDRCLQWLNKQVVTMMSALRNGLGATYFDEWLQGEMVNAEIHRFSKYHEMIIHACKLERRDEDLYNLV